MIASVYLLSRMPASIDVLHKVEVVINVASDLLCPVHVRLVDVRDRSHLLDDAFDLVEHLLRDIRQLILLDCFNSLLRAEERLEWLHVLALDAIVNVLEFELEAVGVVLVLFFDAANDDAYAAKERAPRDQPHSGETTH